jgi:hypothetical protein
MCRGKVADDRSNAAADEVSAFHQVQWFQLLSGFDRHDGSTAASWVKAGAFKSHFYLRPESFNERRVGSL